MAACFLIADFFTARCTRVQSVVLRSHVVCSLTVWPSVCSSVCDVGGLWSHRLEFFENNFTAIVSLGWPVTYFLPPRRYASAGNSDRNVSVCLSVRLSVCHAPVLCQNEESYSVMISSPSGSPMILVFWLQISSQNSKGFPPNGALKKGGVRKFSDFLDLSVNISKTVADTAIESHTWAFDWHQDRWPWMTLNCSKVKFCRIFAWFRDFGRQPRLNELR